MLLWISRKYELILTILLIFFICTTRASMALGNILYGAILLTTFIAYKYSNNHFCIGRDLRQYAKAYLVMLVCILPSSLFSSNILHTLLYYCNIYIWKSLIVIPILLFIKSKKLLYIILSSFFIFMGIDSIVLFFQYIFNHLSGRWGGMFNASVMGMAMLITFAIPVALVTIFDKQMPLFVRKSALFSFFSMMLGIAGNQSRGSWLFSGVNSICISIKYGMANIKYLLIACCIIASIVGIFAQSPKYVERLQSIVNTTSDRSNLGRLYVLNSSLNMIEDYPVTGVGPGLWQTYYKQEYQLSIEIQDLGHSHNNLVQVTAESGLLGLIGFLYFNIYVLAKSIKSYMKRNNPYDLCIVLGWISYIFLFGSIDYTWGNSSGIKIFLVIMAIMVTLKQRELCENKVKI